MQQGQGCTPGPVNFNNSGASMTDSQSVVDYMSQPAIKPRTIKGVESITASRMEQLAFQWGAEIELHGDLAYLTHQGQRYVAVLDGWVA